MDPSSRHLEYHPNYQSYYSTKNDKETDREAQIQSTFFEERVVKSEELKKELKTAYLSLKNENNPEVTLYLEYGKAEVFPLRITAKTNGFEFRIPFKNGGVNKAFHFYTIHRDGESCGHLQDLYPGYGLKEAYKLSGYDLIKLIDVIAEAFELSEITLEDKSSCWKVEGGKAYQGAELEKELERFADLHGLSLDKDSENCYCNNRVQTYKRCLKSPPGGFDLKYSRAMIKGKSWYSEHGYYPASMTPIEYCEYIEKLRATDLRLCFPNESSMRSPFVELIYREFAIHTGTSSEHSLGNFFIWLSEKRPHAISDVIKDLRSARAGVELQQAFYKIEDFSNKMVKKYNFAEKTG